MARGRGGASFFPHCPVFFLLPEKFLERVLRSIDWVFAGMLLFWSVFFLALFSRMLVEDPQGIWAGGRTVWGDWAGHMGYIANWVYGSNLPPANPFFAGTRLSYPFLFDFTSATLVTLGMTLPQALKIPGALLSIALVALLYELTRRIFRSRTAGALSVFIFILSGGLGFVYLFPHRPEWLQKAFPGLAGGVREWTQIPEANIQWVTFIISEMVPQRGILVGIGAALVIFLLWLKGEKKGSNRHFLAAGIVAGLVPFFHAHSYVVILVSGTIYFLLRPQARWGVFFVPAVLLAAPQLFYFFPLVAGHHEGFIRWQPGWMAPGGRDNWLWFWIKNIGAMAFLIPVAWWTFWKRDRRLFFFYLPFAVLFILANLWIFQPWEYDNTKLLRFWYLASSILVAGWFVRWEGKSPLKISGGMLLFAAVILSGAMDAASMLNFEKNKLLMWSPQEIRLAEVVRNITPKKSVFLAADSHNPWVVDLSGRKIVMGYRGWLWSWGIDYRVRENEVQAVFRGDPGANALIKKHKIDYVIIGPREKEAFKANTAFFEENHLLMLDTENHLIFKTR